jgi:hypothetical protein
MSAPAKFSISLSPVIVANMNDKSFSIPISMSGQRENIDEKIEIKALIDSGAGGTFLDQKFATANRMELIPLLKPIRVFNVDGTKNKEGTITHCTWKKIWIDDKELDIRFLITGLGKETAILGLPWLKQYNPRIDWEKGTLDIQTIKFKKTLAGVLRKKFDELRASKDKKPLPIAAWMKEKSEQIATIEEIEDEEDLKPKKETLPANGPILERISEEDDLESYKAYIQAVLERIDEEDDLDLFRTYIRTDGPVDDAWTPLEEEIWIQAKTSISQKLSHGTDTTDKPKKELPERYNRYRKVFEKSASERLLEHKPWDHAIDLKPDFIPKDSKVYPLSPGEQIKMDEFLEDNLQKGYIRPSKSPMASPFSFVSKKEDPEKLRPCQDYRWLNEGTVKNAYPLPLVGDLLDKLKGKKIFTKLDIRWGYNNVRIKPGDEWKAAFKTNKGLYEPLVAFFGLAGMPATFQSMMN